MESDFVLTFQVGGDQTAQPVPEQTPEQAPVAGETAQPEGSGMTPVIVVAVVILAAAAGFVLLRKKK